MDTFNGLTLNEILGIQEEEERRQPSREAAWREALSLPSGGSVWTPPNPVADPAAGYTSHNMAGMPIARGSMTEQTRWTSRTQNWLDRGLNFVSSVLSPVMAPQDIAFAMTEGLLDPNVSLWENWKSVDWGNYTPWTPAPVRATTGRDIARVIGVEDPALQRYFGLVADLFLDPLLIGSALRGMSRAVGGASALMKAADAADNVAQATMLVGGVPTVRTVRNIGAAFNRIAPAPVRAHVQRNMDDLGALMHRVVTHPLRAADPASGTRDLSLASAFVVDGGRSEDAIRAIYRTRQAGTEVAQDVNEAVAQILSAVGDPRAGRWLREIVNSQSLHYDIPRIVSQYDPDTAAALLKSVYDTTRQVGLGSIPGASFGMVGVNLPNAPRMFFQEAVDVARRVDPISPSGIFQRLRQGEDLLAREADRIAALAQRGGYDAGDMLSAWHNAMGKAAQADALMGYHASGMGVLREVFFEALSNRGLGASDIANSWRRYLHETMTGRGEQWLGRVLPDVKAAGGGSITGAEVFGRYGNAFALSADAVIRNVPLGHMRRAFGNFLSPEQWTRYEQQLRQGLMVPSRILDEPTVLPVLQRLNPRLTPMLRQYLEMMTPTGARGQAAVGVTAVGASQVSSNVIDTIDLMQYLVRNGASAQDASNYIRQMVRTINPQLQDVAADVALYRARKIGDVPGTQGSPSGGRGAFAQRHDLDLEHLDVLLEAMDPALSLTQSAAATQRAVGTKNVVAELMRLGQQTGGIMEPTLRRPVPAGWKTIPMDIGNSQPLLAPLAGRALEPTLFREVMNVVAMARQPSAQWQAWQKVRGLITGGYLANPATTATNFAGNFLTAWLHGMPLPQMIRNYVGVLKDIGKQGRNLPEYQAVADLISGTLTANDIARRFPRMAEGVGALAGERGRLAAQITGAPAAADVGSALRRLGENFYNAYQDQILRPGGARSLLGLRHFEASEAVMRMAGYRTAIEMGKNADEAWRIARFMQFDYAAQPRVVEALKNYGLLAFPAFPFFMMGRVANAAVKNPGRLAAIERTPRAIWDYMIESEDEKAALFAAMDDWMRDGKYVPVRNRGDGLWTMFPFAQFLPTDTIGKMGFYDSLQSMGILGPFIDLVVATLSPDSRGEAPLTQRFGRRVFEPTATGPQRFQQTMEFLYNSLAPGWVRKVYRFSETPLARDTGLVPEAVNFARNGFQLSAETGDSLATMTEVMRRRPDRDFLDEVITFTLRSVRPVSAAPGATSGAARQLEGGAKQLERDMLDLAKQIAVARDSGDTRSVTRLTIRLGELQEKFEERYGPIQEITRALPQIYPGVRR